MLQETDLAPVSAVEIAEIAEEGTWCQHLERIVELEARGADRQRRVEHW